jgi:hypothetical protein
MSIQNYIILTGTLEASRLPAYLADHLHHCGVQPTPARKIQLPRIDPGKYSLCDLFCLRRRHRLQSIDRRGHEGPARLPERGGGDGDGRSFGRAVQSEAS